MLTDFGKSTRYIRIMNNEILADMACKLGISYVELSAYENGKNDISNEIINKITKEYNLTIDEFTGLCKLYDELINKQPSRIRETLEYITKCQV